MVLFQNVKVREYLLKRGFVYTLRDHPCKTGFNWANSGRGTRKIADVEVSEVPDGFDLDDYVRDSGFSTLGEWLQAYGKLAKNIRQDMGEMRLYLVRVRKDSTSRATVLAGCA